MSRSIQKRVCWLAMVAAIAASLHAEEAAVKLPNLPRPVTSFGGAVIGDDIYIYGGHEGDAHDYYLEGQSKSLWRLNTSGTLQWKEIAQGPALQGLAMVAHDGKLIRVGGFTAKNKKGDKQDLWSVADVAMLDPNALGEWHALPALPEPRSSFDAAIAGGTIYAIGGWQLQGDGDSVWHKTAYELELAQGKPEWKALPEPPFQRRALSVAALDDKLYVIGGMSKEGPSTAVNVYDIAAKKWTDGPAIPGKGMEGFGNSAFALAGKLYVSTFSGMLYRLSDDGKTWEDEQKLERDRFFHRMLPLRGEKFVFVGGASMTSGKFAEVDVITVK